MAYLSIFLMSSSMSVLGMMGLIVVEVSEAMVPQTWVIGILLTILVSVLSALAVLIKIAYDLSNDMHTTLHGEGGNRGFIATSQERQEKFESKMDRMFEQMLIQGQLLSELSYSFADIAEELEEKEDLDVNVRLDEIRRLRARKDYERWKAEDD